MRVALVRRWKYRMDRPNLVISTADEGIGGVCGVWTGFAMAFYLRRRGITYFQVTHQPPERRKREAGDMEVMSRRDLLEMGEDNKGRNEMREVVRDTPLPPSATF